MNTKKAADKEKEEEEKKKREEEVLLLKKATENGYEANGKDDMFSKLSKLPGLDKNPKL